MDGAMRSSGQQTQRLQRTTPRRNLTVSIEAPNQKAPPAQILTENTPLPSEFPVEIRDSDGEHIVTVYSEAGSSVHSSTPATPQTISDEAIGLAFLDPSTIGDKLSQLSTRPQAISTTPSPRSAKPTKFQRLVRIAVEQDKSNRFDKSKKEVMSTKVSDLSPPKHGRLYNMLHSITGDRSKIVGASLDTTALAFATADHVIKAVAPTLNTVPVIGPLIGAAAAGLINTANIIRGVVDKKSIKPTVAFKKTEKVGIPSRIGRNLMKGAKVTLNFLKTKAPAGVATVLGVSFIQDGIENIKLALTDLKDPSKSKIKSGIKLAQGILEVAGGAVAGATTVGVVAGSAFVSVTTPVGLGIIGLATGIKVGLAVHTFVKNKVSKTTLKEFIEHKRHTRREHKTTNDLTKHYIKEIKRSVVNQRQSNTSKKLRVVSLLTNTQRATNRTLDGKKVLDHMFKEALQKTHSSVSLSRSAKKELESMSIEQLLEVNVHNLDDIKKGSIEEFALKFHDSFQLLTWRHTESNYTCPVDVHKLMQNKEDVMIVG